MDQIIIRVRGADGEYFDKDIKNTCYDERFDAYMGSSFGQIVEMLEKSLNLNKKGVN